ncbi:MAG: AMP-dependent synthetase, partial [bacterium]|nr:AMP-dependent synthetase [bacterium]
MKHEEFTFGGEIVWKPTKEYIERSRLKDFMNTHNLQTFDQLMKRSTGDIAWFTDAVLKFLDIKFQKPYSKVV